MKDWHAAIAAWDGEDAMVIIVCEDAPSADTAKLFPEGDWPTSLHWYSPADWMPKVEEVLASFRNAGVCYALLEPEDVRVSWKTLY